MAISINSKLFRAVKKAKRQVSEKLGEQVEDVVLGYDFISFRTGNPNVFAIRNGINHDEVVGLLSNIMEDEQVKWSLGSNNRSQDDPELGMDDICDECGLIMSYCSCWCCSNCGEEVEVSGDDLCYNCSHTCECCGGLSL